MDLPDDGVLLRDMENQDQADLIARMDDFKATGGAAFKAARQFGDADGI